MNEFMFDTNIFNKILDGRIDASKFKKKACKATHIQFDEIRVTKNENRRVQLIGVFSEIITMQLPTESFVLGVSRLGMAKVSDGDLYNKLLVRLNSLNNSKLNNTQDVLIAETAINNNFILVTDDRNLAQVMTECGGKVCNHKKLLTNNSGSNNV